jgi:predicted esterase
VLLAPAAGRLDITDPLPEGVAVTVVHATRDAIIPRAHSEALAATGSPDRVRLVVVDDEHRLDTLLAGDGLADLVRETWSR